MLLIGGGALLFLLLIISVITVLAILKDGPKDTVESFFDAAEKRDTTGMTDQLCGKLRQEIIQIDGDIFDDGEFLRSEILKVREAERTAEVTVETDIRENGEFKTETVTMILVKEDGKWLICGVREAPDTD